MVKVTTAVMLEVVRVWEPSAEVTTAMVAMASGSVVLAAVVVGRYARRLPCTLGVHGTRCSGSESLREPVRCNQPHTTFCRVWQARCIQL